LTSNFLFQPLQAFCGAAGLPDFIWSKHTKTEKIYQMTANYTKRPCIIPNGHKLYQTAVKYTNIFHSKALQNTPKTGFFGLKINHLATMWSGIILRSKSEFPNHFFSGAKTSQPACLLK
jgi:hypothetical protein